MSCWCLLSALYDFIRTNDITTLTSTCMACLLMNLMIFGLYYFLFGNPIAALRSINKSQYPMLFTTGTIQFILFRIMNRKKNKSK